MVGVGGPTADGGVMANGTLPMKLSPPDSGTGGPSTRVPEVARDLVLAARVWEREDLGGDMV